MISQRSIKKETCQTVPKLMIISGSNGSTPTERGIAKKVLNKSIVSPGGEAGLEAVVANILRLHGHSHLFSSPVYHKTARIE